MSVPSLQQIANSHRDLGSFFTEWNINRLIHLFDTNAPDYDPFHNIIAYINEEHVRQNISITEFTAKSRVHGHMKSNPDPMMIAEILYKGISMVHFTIHVAPETLDASDYGMIHLVKNYYKQKSKYGTLRNGAYVRLHASISQNKPKSITFHMMNSTSLPTKGNLTIDPIIQREMNVLLTVLNRIFDESDREHYVGDYTDYTGVLNMNTVPPLRNHHPKTHMIVSQINASKAQIPRKNKGIPYVIPSMDPSLLPTTTPFIGPRLSLRNSRRRKHKSRRRTLYKRAYRV